VFLLKKKKMSADAPNKPKADPLQQLYKEAAWAIKWVDPGLYQTLTAPGGNEDTKKEQLIAFFRGQGAEGNVVLKESEDGGAARALVLNDDGEGILQALLGMSKSAAVRADRSVQRAKQAEEQTLADMSLWRSYALLLRYEIRDDNFRKAATTTEQIQAVKRAEGLAKGILPESFEADKKDARKNSKNITLPELTQQIKLYKELRGVKSADTYLGRIKHAIRVDGDRDENEVSAIFKAITGMDADRVQETEPADALVDQIAYSVVNYYFQNIVQYEPVGDGYEDFDIFF
jgi:hypothetical protein